MQLFLDIGDGSVTVTVNARSRLRVSFFPAEKRENREFDIDDNGFLFLRAASC